MKRIWKIVSHGWFAMLWALSSAAQGAEQYQFELALGQSLAKVEQGEDAHGEIRAAAFTALLKPVSLNDSRPREIAGFYQSNQGISYGYVDGKSRDLDLSIQGYAAPRLGFRASTWSVFGTIPDTPVWGAFSFARVSEWANIRTGIVAPGFPEELVSTLDYEPEKRITLGLFYHPNQTIYAYFRNYDHEGFGLGFRSFFGWHAHAGIELSAFIESLTEENGLQQLVFSGGSLSVETHDSKLQNRGIGLSIFANRDLSLGLMTSNHQDNQGFREERFGGLISWWLNSRLNLKLGYWEQHLNKLGHRYPMVEGSQFWAGLGIRF